MKVHLPLIASATPGWKWRWTRRVTQLLAFVAICVAPLLGGWQRLDRNYLSAWDGHGWDLPAGLLDRLPLGDAPARAYEVNEMLGGGLAGRYATVPAIDPVAGVVAWTASAWSLRMALAWLIPVLLGVLAGRAFCGWFCPFGTLARIVDALLDRLPWRPPRWQLPRRRPLRWALLGASVILGLLGANAFLYFTLPHLFVQQSGYALWLMSGGGAVLGWLVGLLGAGVVFGPTAYCATLCPTGAALNLLGRKRAVRVALAKPSSCGMHCHLCSSACWLGLDPASGDPGPDCDGCARCFSVCPRTNMRVGIARRPWAPVAAAAALLLLLSSDARADEPRGVNRAQKPAMVLDAETRVGDVRVVGSVIDLTGVKNDPDDPVELSGVRVSVVVMRGERGAPDELGKLPLRQVYQGPLRIELEPRASAPVVLEFAKPSSPSSTVRRSVYEREIPTVTLVPGDVVRVAPLPGWTDAPVTWVVPGPTPAGWSRFAYGAAASFLLFGGLLSLALAGKNSAA